MPPPCSRCSGGSYDRLEGGAYQQPSRPEGLLRETTLDPAKMAQNLLVAGQTIVNLETKSISNPALSLSGFVLTDFANRSDILRCFKDADRCFGVYSIFWSILR